MLLFLAPFLLLGPLLLHVSLQLLMSLLLLASLQMLLFSASVFATSGASLVAWYQCFC